MPKQDVLLSVIQFIEYQMAGNKEKLENHLDICDTPTPCRECQFFIDKGAQYKLELNNTLGIRVCI